MSLQISLFLVNYFINCIIDNFLCCFICSAQSQAFFFLCYCFLAVDKTFLKAHFVQSLLLAVIINVSRQNTLLIWAVMKSKSQELWEYFFQHLKRAILKVSLKKCTLMSNCDKKLLKAEEMLENQVIKAYCCHHLKKNFVIKFKCKLTSLFWSAACVRTSSAFEKAISKIKNVKAFVRTYLRGIIS